MVVSVIRIFLIRQNRQIRQIQIYGNQAEKRHAYLHLISIIR